ncbi:MAG: hypothetical protein H5U39_00075 [Deferribacterales bacterium]|nr:hypothetical protein [Deferribacterales bacterium]
MSYFVSGYKSTASCFNNLENIFIDIVPDSIRKDSVTCKAKQAYLSIYGTKKAISDILIYNKETDSWISIIGTPIIELKNDEEEKSFLTSFFNDPKSVIREKIDGCWCILAYDATNDKFYACTDYNNTIPIYYSKNKDGIHFTSHELPLARFLGSQIDPLGFSMSIQLMLTWGNYTRFKNIKKLLPAEILIFKGLEKKYNEQYWKASEEKQWPANFDIVISDWIDILKKSVYSYYAVSKNKKVLCDITGGEDSRLVLSAVHNLEIPFTATVDGNEDHLDVIIARRLSKKGGFGLLVRPKPLLPEELLLAKAIDISLFEDAYRDYFASCIDYAMYLLTPSINYDYVKYCGDPGGEIFRGSYYLRGKAIFPSSKKKLDHIFFTRMKFMLDFVPNLLIYPDEEFKKVIFKMVEQALEEVNDFPIGIKIDHLLRIFQVCNMGLIYKIPRYKPLASRELTKSIYKIPPKFKKEGKLTKACTEILYPEIAMVKNQKGVPTIRKNIFTFHYFIPEYIWTMKLVTTGAITRLFKWKSSSKLNLNWERNSNIIKCLLKNPPYSKWFSSCDSMVTGSIYNFEFLDSILKDSRERGTRLVPTLGRIISQELACRWVYKEY